MKNNHTKPMPFGSHLGGSRCTPCDGAAEPPHPSSLRPFLRIVIMVSMVLLVTACSKLTETNLQKIHNGMTPDEVKAILGDPTSSQTGSALGIISGTTYIYHTDTSDVKVTFMNDKVIATEGEFK